MSLNNRELIHVLAVAAFLGFSGCGDDDKDADMCTAGTTEGCGGGRVCELVEGGDPACFDPVQIRGRVFDSTTDEGIGDATIVALDVNGIARSPVAVSEADGTYVLPVPSRRNADGVPLMDQVTLRVAAQGYQPFPTAPRSALPIDLDGGTFSEGENATIIRNAATDVALIPLEGDVTGLGTISGRVDHDDSAGVLVVADQGMTAVSTAITDNNGDFTLFNVPAGPTRVSGYRAGLTVTPADVTATADAVRDVVLAASTDGLATVSGSVNVVNGGDCTTMSVILVVASTFVETVARGEAPAGLRVAGISSEFTIPDVPPGSYVVLAAFENDFCVRDPDTSIGGTTIQRIDVMGADVMLADSFKITGALAVIGPGVDGIETVSAPPTFTWEDDSSEDAYEFFLYDALGNLVHENLAVPSPGGGEDVVYTPAGVTYEEGMIYQFRAFSYHDEATGHVRISATEDLRGVFLFDTTPPMMSM